jgi:cysteine desulfurase/selenocysteine lyase
MRMTNEMALKLRLEFPIFNNGEGKFVYLDSASTMQMPYSVIDVISDHYKKGKSNVGRGVYDLNQRTTDKYAKARGAVAKFINADPNEIIFTRNATEGINLLSRTVGRFLEGDNIVLTEMEHHANLLPWQQLARRRRMELRFIKMKDDFTLDIEDAEKKIDKGTCLVGMNHVSNVFGTVNDLTEVIELAKDNGAITVVDSCQGVGHMPVDVQDLNCDYMVFSGHKIFGPTGIGVLFGVYDLLAETPPFMEGGGMVKDAEWNDAEWEYPPLKFEAGTPNVAGAIGFAKAIEFAERVGLEEIAKWNKDLTMHSMLKLKEIPGLKFYAADVALNSGIISFTLQGLGSHEVAKRLNEKGICVRSGKHCTHPVMKKLGLEEGVVRISFAPYNTKGDVDYLAECLRSITKP